MAERLEFDTPAAAPAEGGERKLEFDTPSREKELRAEYLKKLMAPGEPGYSQRLKDSATLGLMRPIGGVMQGVAGLADPTSSFGERYRAGVGAEEDYAKRAVENTPGAAGVATDVAGGVGSMGGARSLLLTPAKAALEPATSTAAAALPERASLAKLMGQGAGMGAVEGAARDAKDPASAAVGAATGGVLGAGTSAAVGSALKYAPGVKGAQQEARKAAQGDSPEELKAAAKPLFQALDMGGIAYGQPQTATLKRGIDDLIANNQYNPIAHQKISGYVDELAQKAQAPQGMGFNELSNLRSALAKEARGNDASTREAAGKVIEKIDDLVLHNKPAINPTNRDVAGDYEQARKLWRSATVAEDVGWRAGKAERQAASKAGVNPDEANRGAFRPVLDKAEKPGAYSPYGPKGSEQRDLLAKIVQGDKLQNTYRNVGAAVGSPVTRGLAGAAAAGLGLAHGGIGLGAGALGGGAAVGGAVKGMLDRAAAARGEQNIDALMRSITGSSPKPIPPEALRTLLAKQAAQRGGAAYGASATGE